MKGLFAKVVLAGCLSASLFFRLDVSASTPKGYLGAPVITNAKEIEEGRFETRLDFDSAKKWFQKQFQGMDNIKLKKLVNQPGVKAVHFANTSPASKWEGINLYQINRIVRFYIIPRKTDEEKKGKRGKEKGNP
ncbi:MAG: hypothetical protein Kow0090_21390 [Myxococcota bacterium]